MIKVYYEEYYNDYRRNEKVISLYSLNDVADWIFNQMRCDYSKNKYVLNFPTPEKAKRIGENGPWEINFHPEFGGPIYCIHKIEENSRIIFSDGKMTARQKHWSKAVQEWCEACEERRKNPVFDFAE